MSNTTPNTRIDVNLAALDTRITATDSATEEATARQVTSSYFAKLTLSWHTISTRLDAEDSEAFKAFVLEGRAMSKQCANHVAEQVKRWALEKGAMFYSHWFHPMTGIPSDKHDSFLGRGVEPGQALAPIEQFPGSRLLWGEPDASSFPSGGLRATHAARGYTAWDPRSPMFIRSDGSTRTLCIPCTLVSWAGHALDLKTPLLRAADAVNRELPPLLNMISGRDTVKGVFPTLGTEQEYFLIDKRYLATRPDLVLAGRTLCGAPPPRGQQLEDHYFGPIPARVQSFIADAEYELTLLGIPVKTRHCEVAPAQFELAPIFEEVNVACDHNILTMDVMRRVAERHNLACILHEKPFAGVNGSGKHNNWSLSTSDGDNLLEPGNDPANNLRYLVMLAAVFLAVHRHADMMRVTIASAGNDHRLGANEAPPSIISVYLGGAMDRLVRNVQEGRFVLDFTVDDIQVTETIMAKKDLTDRNRTTPFAFTGNKFEFRAVGSSENSAWPMTVLNTAFAEAARDLRMRLETKLGRHAREDAVRELVREVFLETQAVRFEGNNYAKEWVEEAARRGLPNLPNTPAALAVLQRPAATRFLVDFGVFTDEEVAARYHVYAEKYIKTLDIEACTLAEIATTQVIPAIEAQLANTGNAHAALQGGGVTSAVLRGRLTALSSLLDQVSASAGQVEALRGKVHHQPDLAAGMQLIIDQLVPAAEGLRAAIDAAEALVADAHWPLAKYREMLFLGV